jgi:hypothetical protein
MKSITIQNSIDDLEDYYRYWVFSSKPGKRYVKNGLIFLQGCYLVFFLLVWGFTDIFFIAFGTFLIFETVFLILANFKPRHWYAKRVINNYLKNVGDSNLQLFSQPKELEISDERINISNQDWSSSMSWNIVVSIKRSSYSIIIYYGIRSILIIPRRSFESDQEFDSFYEDICEMLGAYSSDQFPKTMDVVLN